MQEAPGAGHSLLPGLSAAQSLRRLVCAVRSCVSLGEGAVKSDTRLEVLFRTLEEHAGIALTLA